MKRPQKKGTHAYLSDGASRDPECRICGRDHYGKRARNPTARKKPAFYDRGDTLPPEHVDPAREARKPAKKSERPELDMAAVKRVQGSMRCYDIAQEIYNKLRQFENSVASCRFGCPAEECRKEHIDAIREVLSRCK